MSFYVLLWNLPTVNHKGYSEGHLFNFNVSRQQFRKALCSAEFKIWLPWGQRYVDAPAHVKENKNLNNL